MRFAEPFNFLLLILVLFFGIFLFWAIARKKKLLNLFGDLPLIMKNAPYISFIRQRTKALLLIVGLVFIVFALARLQFGTHLEKVKREGLDIVVALDVSNSMLVRDMKPDRLTKAKQQLQGIIDRLQGDRIGLVAFAGNAFTQCPLTLDYSSARLLLRSLNTESVSIQGTNLTDAIETSSKMFDKETKKYKILLLLTDGEDHSENVETAAALAREQGIKIYTVGIGNPNGEPIPIVDRNNIQVGYKKDKNGEVIVSKLHDDILKEISMKTGGKYYHATAGEIELDAIFDEISNLEKKELEGSLVTRYDDRFQWPLLIALFFIVGEFFLSEKKKPLKD
ncbi:MAG: VWA domain-containing protein [Calditrichaeota bacterium]|nr:MAG: VWA domain-containing protein [Calditrichota bacterium]